MHWCADFPGPAIAFGQSAPTIKTLVVSTTESDFFILFFWIFVFFDFWIINCILSKCPNNQNFGCQHNQIWFFNFGFQDFFWTSSCIWSKCSDDQNFACRKQPKLNQNCAEYQPRRHNFKHIQNILFSTMYICCVWRNVIVFAGLGLNGLGSISKWNQIHNQLENAKIDLLLRSLFWMDKVSWRKNSLQKMLTNANLEFFSVEKSDFTFWRWLLEILRKCCKINF